jgi:hypothetical protein
MAQREEGDCEMLKFYVRWRINPKQPIKTAEELEELELLMLERVKANLQAGGLKDWGICVDGSGGYSVFEVASEAELFAYLRQSMPYVDFDVRQVLTVEQAIESRRAAASQASKRVS